MEFLTSFIAFAKGIFPATIGSVVAVWRKRNEVNFREMDAYQKASMILVALFAILVGVCIGKWVGGAVAAYYTTTPIITTLIEFVTALNGLKIVDSAIKSVEAALDIVTKNVPVLVGNVVELISDKIEKIFGKK
ncbi:hypothetical protein Aci011_054 [Acinetobacter phage vB_AbaM_B09_Aci01-1]|uniref:Uncharacterized protein n=3 Tax=Saclayvirus TaxID=2733128 RepID=A0A386KK22_9CAUD|nr:hypothetical protein HOU29_gp127 [Acinetobacter phage vB_AbaM_B09_Aci01-1]YP_009813277.1 hypothetical protein HOU30_gp135 [Acinetobacter phage vB_AbaM_B09_Aci02-2]YP_009813907.1 hypothetical protein HOU35_gp124 [Acinetobacter phage vB_AbaM_B09_Aci05]AYD82387.1 hypothetical protein Aci05_053 [Acinetobacter phage vB_AbaM_B09_Aci05]AYD85602.1 hypothetical protein Aci011_054 [Acinetobacter phage vB_AbaM_B09_Aci01-1]AYD85762.1 hypothetical protein Aci022_055 [Acinetobacter phage vB_AbaM_B09_Aci0